MTEQPMYRRIAEDQRLRIEAGELLPGGRLPTEQDLMSRYRASRNTIRSAVQWLIKLGLVETRPGQGCFVTEKVVPFVTTLSGDWQTDEALGGGEGEAAFKEAEARQRAARASTPQVTVEAASGYVASQLGIPEGANVISRRQERYIDDQPWSVQTTLYPMTLLDRGARRLLEAGRIDEGTVRYVTAALGTRQVGYRDVIRVRSPDQSEATFLRLPDDGRIPVAVVLRTGYAERPDGPGPFRLTKTVFPADRNQFVINAGQVPDRLAQAVQP